MKHMTSPKFLGAILGFAVFFTATSSRSEEAYLGVSGYITTVPHDWIVETTTASRYCDLAPSMSKGFKVRSVQQDSPAYHAGFRTGDVFIEAHGIFINSYSSLARMRRALAQNDSMEVYYVRNGHLRSTHVGARNTITTVR